MNYKYVSINRIFSKLIRDLGAEVPEGDVVEWCGEALEFIGATRLYEEAVAFVEVKNHTCQLPKGLHAVIQIARNNRWCGPQEDVLCPKKVVEEISVEDGPDIPVAIDCNGEPINGYDLAYYRPFFDLRYEYDQWRSSTMYTSAYSPVRLATNTFNSLVCEDRNHSDLSGAGSDQYSIKLGKTLTFSFEEGSVAIAYLRQVVDEETGYPMVPDNISYTTAITKYITMKIFERAYYAGRDGAGGKMQKAESDWHWYCKQASNVDMMPYGIDEHQNLLDQRSYILPRQGLYNSFFGSMATPESRKYNDPDGRNNHVNFFRGN